MSMRLYFLLLLLVNTSGAQSIFVSSRNTNSVKRYDLEGNYLGDFVTTGSGGLSLPQEVLWHPDGFLLVTGRGNTAVKKYDGATGAYLGNFTNGYALDNPTKTSIWRDSLLVVSQWGAVKNKIVRFDLKTGAFLDEFTKIGVPNGCGHAWDNAGNLLVAQYGNGTNGKVWKFDPMGVFLGDFIPTTLLQGPVNLWFDAENSLYVADWTLGAVLRFEGDTGDFQENLLGGLANVEGFAVDDTGHLYLCDWTANKVFRYDFDSAELSPFITTGGLAAPNSLLIRGETSPTSDVSEEKMRLECAPNPAGEQLCIRYFLPEKTALRLDLLNACGQLVATLFSGEQNAGAHEFLWSRRQFPSLGEARGLFFLRISGGGKIASTKLVWR